MGIRICPVTRENEKEILKLHVAKGQEGFIETTAQCMGEAHEFSQWRPVGLYEGEELVGFAMYGLWKSEGKNGRVWLDRFLIDGRFQGKGYGKEALLKLLRRLKEEYQCDEVYLSLYEDNKVASHLYEEFGFCYNGELDMHGEKVMVLKKDALDSLCPTE